MESPTITKKTGFTKATGQDNLFIKQMKQKKRHPTLPPKPPGRLEEKTTMINREGEHLPPNPKTPYPKNPLRKKSNLALVDQIRVDIDMITKNLNITKTVPIEKILNTDEDFNSMRKNSIGSNQGSNYGVLINQEFVNEVKLRRNSTDFGKSFYIEGSSQLDNDSQVLRKSSALKIQKESKGGPMLKSFNTS